MKTAIFTAITFCFVLAAAGTYAQTSAPKPADDPGGAIFEKGVDQMTAKQFNEAIITFRAYSRVEPDDPSAYLNTGLAYYNMRKYDQALTELKIAVKMKPNYARAWRYIGGSYFNLRKYPDAAEAYRTAVRYQKDFTEAWVWLGTTYESMNQFTDAIDAYKQAVAIESDNPAAWFGIGSSRYILGDYGGAISAINRWKDIGHNSGEEAKRNMADLYLGHSYLEIREYPPAVASFMRVLATDPNNVRAIFGLGEIYIAMKKPSMVAQQKAKLDKLDPVFAAKLQRKIAEAGIK